jgi:hypothetical protein
MQAMLKASPKQSNAVDGFLQPAYLAGFLRKVS